MQICFSVFFCKINKNTVLKEIEILKTNRVAQDADIPAKILKNK